MEGGFGVWSLFCCAVFSVGFSFAIILLGKIKLFALVYLPVDAFYLTKYELTFPHGTVGWCAVLLWHFLVIFTYF